MVAPLKIIDGKKRCGHCRQMLPVSMFRQDKTTATGLFSFCRSCASEYAKTHCKDNPYIYKRSQLKYILSGKAKENQRKWRKEHPGLASSYTKKWQAANKDKQRELERKRRARKVSATGSHTVEDINNIIVRQGNRCSVCRVKLVKRHIDHIIPLALGGSDDKCNIQILCPKCNMSKGKKDPIEFMQSRGFLL